MVEGQVMDGMFLVCLSGAYQGFKVYLFSEHWPLQV